jgi:ornithine carbamoyltransferase
MKGRDLDTMFSFSGDEQRALLRLSAALKARLRAPDAKPFQPLLGKTMSMIFQKRSTRTRVSVEAGFAQLGGHAIFLGALGVFLRHVGPAPSPTPTPPPPLPPPAHPPTGSEDIQLGKNETLRDTATVLARYNDLVLARVYAHADIDELCRRCDKPVINALSDGHHPLQLLADAMTLEEEFGSVAGLTLGWVGDGNNILSSLLSAAGPLGFNVQYATPPGFEPPAAVTAAAAAAARAAGVRVEGSHDPLRAVRGADAILTDTWVSMGQEAEAAARVAAFKGFQVTEELAKRGGAKPGWVFLHCLPRKPHEVDDAVFYGPRTRVWDEAENRKWTFQAVALAQLCGGASL